MTSSINLGFKPETLRVSLVTGADFTSTLRLNEAWPVGTTLSLVLGGTTTWNATIAGADATWNVDKATADLVAHDTSARLVYTNGTTDQVWALGTVVRHG